MFYGRFKIRVFSDTLRSFADGRIAGPNEGGQIPVIPAGTSEAFRPPSITDLPELDLMFREIFIAPDALVCMNPLDEEGRNYWSDLGAAYEKGKFEKSREMAASLADWLDKTYQKSERLQFDDASFSVLLDGELFARLQAEGYALLKMLAMPQERGEYASAVEIITAFRNYGSDKSTVFTYVRKFPKGPAGLKRLSRAVAALPPSLRNVIQSKRGRGRRLCLEPA